jgi:hypothetical protein
MESFGGGLEYVFRQAQNIRPRRSDWDTPSASLVLPIHTFAVTSAADLHIRYTPWGCDGAGENAVDIRQTAAARADGRW